MLHAHSPLWHYLWLAPNILGLILVVCLWGKPVRKRYPFFISYLVFVSLEQICLYWMDISPAFSAWTWWKAFWIGAIVEALLKFAVIAELLRHLLHPWHSIAILGRKIATVSAVILIFAAAIAAAYAVQDTPHWLVGGGHALQQTIYLAQAGLILSIFVLAAYFHIPWSRTALGIAIGLGLVWCEHLAIWALISGGIVKNQPWVDLANMATFHVCIVVWFYQLVLARQDIPSAAPLTLPKSDLDLWNRELEHLLQKRSEPVES